MQYMSEMGSALKTLIADRQASDARADAAEAANATLKAQIAADEATLKGMLDATNEEIGEETPASSAPTATVTTTAPSGATVTVDPTAGTTTHVDPAAAPRRRCDHASGTATAVDASVTPAQPVEPAPAAVSEATAAATAARRGRARRELSDQGGPPTGGSLPHDPKPFRPRSVLSLSVGRQLRVQFVGDVVSTALPGEIAHEPSARHSPAVLVRRGCRLRGLRPRRSPHCRISSPAIARPALTRRAVSAWSRQCPKPTSALDVATACSSAIRHC